MTAIVSDPSGVDPCPFCGTNVLAAETDSSGDACWQVQCRNPACDASGPRRTSQEDAIRAWNAAERRVDWVHLRASLAKPLPRSRNDACFSSIGELFDPWEDVIRGIDGSYMSDFDDLMIEALEAARDGKQDELTAQRGLAGELALHILSGHGLTDYGISPSGGWPDYAVEDLWQPLIDRWKGYRRVMWGDGGP